VIDTDSYAGNFEREMRQWVTGYIGEHDPGGLEYMYKVALEELGAKVEEIWDYLGSVNHDEYGRMNVIMTNRNGQEGYNSVAIMFETKPPDDLLKLMATRALSFPEARRKNDSMKSWMDMKKYKMVKVLCVRFESYKVLVEMEEQIL
jgi:hypothetical protein